MGSSHPSISISEEENFNELDDHDNNEEDTDLLIFIDSNKRHIDWRKFWTLKGSSKKFRGSFYNIDIARSVKHVLINVGVNDLETKPAEEAVNQVKKIINMSR